MAALDSREVAMSINEEFPVLTQTRRVPSVVLQFLETIRQGGPNRILISSVLSSQLDSSTLQALPEIVERELGPSHPEYVKVLHRLAVLHHARSDAEQAQACYRRALDAAAAAFQKPTEEWGLILNNLGRLLYDGHRLGEAEQFYRQSLEMLQQVFGLEHPKLATPMNNLAKLYAAQGRPEIAERFYRDAIRILEKAYGPNHPAVTKARERLAKHRKAMV